IGYILGIISVALYAKIWNEACDKNISIFYNSTDIFSIIVFISFIFIFAILSKYKNIFILITCYALMVYTLSFIIGISFRFHFFKTQFKAEISKCLFHQLKTKMIDREHKNMMNIQNKYKCCGVSTAPKYYFTDISCIRDV
ncbi:hypothetical protein HZS_892, partial [Henneguya salminicola]